MKIITWNCNGAFRKKFETISNFNADIYIIQECEDPAKSVDKKYQKWAENYIWIGDNKNKGLAIFANHAIKLEMLDWSNQFKNTAVKYFLPCKINDEFNLVAVWTHRNNSPNFGYIGQLWKYVQVNRNKLQNSIIAGDFNSNTIWDISDRWWNHSDVVRELQEIGLESLYHKFKDEIQGKESIPTLYFQRNHTKTYHIDYVFAHQRFIEKIQKLEIGHPDNWLSISDHMPMYCEFE